MVVRNLASHENHCWSVACWNAGSLALDAIKSLQQYPAISHLSFALVSTVWMPKAHCFSTGHDKYDSGKRRRLRMSDYLIVLLDNQVNQAFAKCALWPAHTWLTLKMGYGLQTRTGSQYVYAVFSKIYCIKHVLQRYRINHAGVLDNVTKCAWINECANMNTVLQDPSTFNTFSTCPKTTWQHLVLHGHNSTQWQARRKKLIGGSVLHNKSAHQRLLKLI